MEFSRKDVNDADSNKSPDHSKGVEIGILGFFRNGNCKVVDRRNVTGAVVDDDVIDDIVVAFFVGREFCAFLDEATSLVEHVNESGGDDDTNGETGQNFDHFLNPALTFGALSKVDVEDGT